jgi:hypothetical protein
MKLRQERNMSVAYAFIMLIIGLTISGGAIVIMQQILGVKLHYIALSLGLGTAGVATLGMLDDFLGWLPIAITVAAVSGMIIVAYRARYEI